MRRSSSAADPEPRVAALRTPVAIGAALALGLGVLLVPAAERAVAQGLPANPHLVVDPECGAPVDDVGGEVTLTFRLYNMPLGDQVTIVWDVTSEFRRFYDVAPDAYGFLETTLTVPQRDASPIQVDVQHTSDFDDVPDTIATAYFYAPCPPSITIDPVCDAPADPADPRREVTIDVVGSNFSAFGVPVTVTLEGPQGVVAGPVEVTVDRATRGFGTQIRSPALPVGEYRVVASQPRFDVTYVEFSVPCPAPDIRLTPASGDAGGPPDRYAILIDGSGFAENWAVEFYFGIEGGSWQRFL